MSKLFCLSPGLRVLERQMQEPPGYRPRGYGICIIEEMDWKSRGNYSEIVDCVISRMQLEHLKKRVEEIFLEAVIAENARVGSYTDEFDERYRRIAEDITTLKEEQIEARRKKKLADSYEQRLKDMDSFLEKQTCQIPEFDNDLVRRLIASIKVVSAEKLIIQFQSGIVMEQEIRYE